MVDRSDIPGQPAAGQGVYGISVAAELSGVPVQSLRLYEQHGLLRPSRSDGNTRRYSADDLARLRRISELVSAGINLAGIARILDLEDHNAELLATNRAMNVRAARKAKSDQDPSHRDRARTASTGTDGTAYIVLP